MRNDIALFAGMVVLAFAGFVAYRRVFPQSDPALGGAVGSRWLFASGTPDAVKDNRATLPVTNGPQWDATVRSIGSFVDNVYGSAQNGNAPKPGYTYDPGGYAVGPDGQGLV